MTLSRRQVKWPRERIEQSGLQRRVSIELRDFRTLTRGYDHVVSIEAYEVAGEAAWGAHFDTIARCLVEGGKAFFQGGIIADRPLTRPRQPGGFVRTHIHRRRNWRHSRCLNNTHGAQGSMCERASSIARTMHRH